MAQKEKYTVVLDKFCRRSRSNVQSSPKDEVQSVEWNDQPSDHTVNVIEDGVEVIVFCI